MFAADALTAWVEAFKAVLHDPAYDNDEVRDIPVNTEFPMREVDYPGLWLNYLMQGDMKTVGVGHEEFYRDEDDQIHKAFRWHFGGTVDITIGAMGNLERARLFDEISRIIAVARADENREGILRSTIERHDLIGQIVTWDSITVGGFGETPGTPWGTDDVIYEVTLSLTTSGEVLLDPQTQALVPLSSIVVDFVEDQRPILDETVTPGPPEPLTDGTELNQHGLPKPGTGGWL